MELEELKDKLLKSNLEKGRDLIRENAQLKKDYDILLQEYGRLKMDLDFTRNQLDHERRESIKPVQEKEKSLNERELFRLEKDISEGLFGLYRTLHRYFALSVEEQRKDERIRELLDKADDYLDTVKDDKARYNYVAYRMNIGDK